MKNKQLHIISALLFLLVMPFTLFANTANGMPHLFGIRLEFIVFALTLAGVAIFHHKTLYVALVGLAVLLVLKYIYVADFSFVHHIIGDSQHDGEWRILTNLFGLLLGFAVLAKYFEESGVPNWLPKILPSGWKGGFVLLFAIFVLSSFLDNIAAAMIGGTIAMVVYKRKVHIGYLAAIIAASNAGGSGSVIGDTTTTLMWIDGVNPLDVTHAYVAAFAAFLVFGYIGSKQQSKYQSIEVAEDINVKVDKVNIFIVFMILALTVTTNYLLDFPALGVWIGIIIGSFLRKAPWAEVPKALLGSLFLLALVTCASLIPVEELPKASWQSALSLGFISSVFDNIPLTNLCLNQGGYDWGVLAYAVGFGGSMIWFGSSAGVALSNKFPQIRSVVQYVKHGWHVILAYIVGFAIMILVVGWHPHAPHRKSHQEQLKQQIEATIESPVVNE